MLTDNQELKKAQCVHKNQLSACYASYNTPVLSDLKDKNGQRIIAYPCKTCGTKIHRPTYKTSPTNLAKHVASCTKKLRESQGSQKLAAMGVLGTGDIDPQEVPQLCAIWCAQAARPFASLGETSHLAIIHPTIAKNLPKRRTVSNDIAKLYTAVQESLIESLKHHKGAMYLGLDAWQSPNGFDVLGTVLYQLVEEDKGGIYHLEATPLDFVTLQKSHTGVYLAKTVQLIVEKFGLKEKIHGIVTDNASNNKTMIEEIKTYWWPCFKGEMHWVRCFAHILNLIAQVILRPFGSHKRKNNSTSTVVPAFNSDSDESEEEEEPEDRDDQIQLRTGDSAEDEGEDNNDDGSIINDSVLAAKLIDDEEVELDDDDVKDLSDEEDDD
ncbi:hypothetical protein PTTG_28973 [Puccinia triticina 1-1 BBBD Race 1]|uniref:DUF659 domain-containing protein n=1 Tax=Puccinia triticina (isolate 1-1 / race 1 (BBBD)) TaxID=630390 RepID=A0A180G7I1_PUCT1|nr:hypothetical protein PTTG_28973 [Puccinia triticina 1-1 BBBD Race 1]